MQARRQRILGSIWHQTKRVLRDGWNLSKKLVKRIWDWIQRLAANNYFLLTANFFAAVAFAIVHHFYYDSLAGTPPPSGVFQLYGPLLQISAQSVNVAIGTLIRHPRRRSPEGLYQNIAQTTFPEGGQSEACGAWIA